MSINRRLVKVVLLHLVAFTSSLSAGPLVWKASPSTTGTAFDTQAQAVADFQTYGGIYELMTEPLPATYQDDTKKIKYKIPDASLDIGDWSYEHYYGGPFATEQADYDNLLQTLINLRMSGYPGTFCAPYVELVPSESVPWVPTSTSSNNTYIQLYGIPKYEDKYIGKTLYQPDAWGICYSFSGGEERLLRQRTIGCPTNLTYDSELGVCTNPYRATVTGISQYQLKGPNNPKPCDLVGNPCVPASGKKFQVEVDVPATTPGAVPFVRYYNSLGDHNSGVAMAAGWRHSYDRRLNESPPAVEFPPQLESQLYSSPSAACTQGWNDIKATLWSGSLATGTTVAYVGNFRCRIQKDGKTVAYLPVSPTLDHPVPLPQPSLSSSMITATRPDGTVHQFENKSGLWVDPFDPSVKLEYISGNWQFTDSDKNRELYDSTGKLLSITNVRGVVRILTYDANDRLERVDADTGEYLSFAYDASDRISSVTDQANRIWTYRYNSYGNLEFVDNPDGNTRQYHYEDPSFVFALTGITDERGIRYATWAYDTAGKVVLSEHAGGVEQVDLAYNPDGTTTVTSSRGGIWTYHFDIVKGARQVSAIVGDLCPSCPNGNKKARTYTSDGYLAGYTDWSDSVTKLGNYGAEGQVGCRVEGITLADTAMGECAFDAVASPEARRTDYTYDSRFHGKVTTMSESSVFGP